MCEDHTPATLALQPEAVKDLTLGGLTAGEHILTLILRIVIQGNTTTFLQSLHLAVILTPLIGDDLSTSNTAHRDNHCNSEIGVSCSIYSFCENSFNSGGVPQFLVQHPHPPLFRLKMRY